MQFLTSLRGLAALLVVLFHAKLHIPAEYDSAVAVLVKNGFLAVDFFFIMSGFILALNYSEKFETLSFPDYASFMWKRIARIYPLHLFIMLSYTTIPLSLYLTGRNPQTVFFSADSFVAKILLIDVWWLGHQFTWNVPSWTISAEFLAYLMFPILILPISKLSAWRLFVFAVIILIVLAGLFYFSGVSSIGMNIGKLGVFRCLLEFSLGIMIYFALFRHKLVSATIGRLLMLSGITFLFVGATLQSADYFYVPLSFVMLLSGLISHYGIFHRALEWKPLLYLGKISYSVYLSHFFVLNSLIMLTLENDEIAGIAWVSSYVIITLIFSSLTYWLVEVPSRRWLVSNMPNSLSQPMTER